jgi:ribosomal protein S1
MIDAVLAGQDAEGADAVYSRNSQVSPDRPRRRRAEELNLVEGDVREGVVTKCVDFGVFVDLEDAEGPAGTLVHQSRIAKGTLLHEGSKVTVKHAGFRQGRPEFDLVKVNSS